MTIRILTGDCREILRTLSDNSVHCCVTSPPYFGLRDYGHAGQIGLEPTPAEYVEQMVQVFREVRRVLRADGTLWLNLGDSYTGSASTGGTGKETDYTGARSLPNQRAEGLKPKDLIGIPWRVAFALQADGWYLRQDIIWSKPNPMPESVRDRCTKAHEYVFLLSKSERYHYDADAIAEDATGRAPGNHSQKGTAALEDGDEKHRTKAGLVAYAQRQRSRRDSFKREASKRAEAIPGQTVGTHRADRAESDYDTDTRNKRSVWTIATQPYSEAHFATMAPELAETCIKAGCPPGGIVLDPFGGAGTTGLVADRLQRSAVLIELNPSYVELQQRRIGSDAPLFTQIEGGAG
ncbi:MAG: site-specific DNA-methyltransferase [Inhella sp.]|nr:site-specific DNA-methyltransferase [Inhella sp.]